MNNSHAYEKNTVRRTLLFAAVMLVLIGAVLLDARNDTLEICFLDVGEGDCAFITCGGRTMMIDGGNAGSSSKVYSYLKTHGIERLDYIICTHPDADHIGGVPGALSYAKVGKILSPVSEDGSRTFAALKKVASGQKTKIKIPEAGEKIWLGRAKAEILSPEKGYDAGSNTSIVMKLTFRNTSFLFTGDAEFVQEQEMTAKYGNLLKSDVLKVGHHGSDSSTSEEFLKAAGPAYAVISVGKNNAYGHPAPDVLKRLKENGCTLFRTDMQGSIICRSDGKKCTFETEKNPEADTYSLPEETESAKPDAVFPMRTDAGKIPEKETDGQETAFILNKNTRKFHLPGCTSANGIRPENREEFTGTREELVEQGYSPCGNCKP